VLISRRKRIGKIRNKPTSIAATSLFAVTLGGIGILPGSALAQTPSPLGEWQYSVGIPLQKMWQPEIPDWQLRVGAATSFQPRYEGSDRYHVMGGPSVDVRYKDLFFFFVAAKVSGLTSPRGRTGARVSRPSTISDAVRTTILRS
jgi:hypothetical protein